MTTPTKSDRITELNNENDHVLRPQIDAVGKHIDALATLRLAARNVVEQDYFRLQIAAARVERDELFRTLNTNSREIDRLEDQL